MIYNFLWVYERQGMKDILNIALEQHFLSQSWLVISDHMNFPSRSVIAPTRKEMQGVMNLRYHENETILCNL